MHVVGSRERGHRERAGEAGSGRAGWRLLHYFRWRRDSLETLTLGRGGGIGKGESRGHSCW